MAVGSVRYWAAARAAAGVDGDEVDAPTVAAALDAVRRVHADRPRLAAVLSICAFVLDGAPVGARPHGTVELHDGWVLEALPPFAGG